MRTENVSYLRSGGKVNPQTGTLESLVVAVRDSASNGFDPFDPMSRRART
jgi:hypothetical protein